MFALADREKHQTVELELREKNVLGMLTQSFFPR